MAAEFNSQDGVPLQTISKTKYDNQLFASTDANSSDCCLPKWFFLKRYCIAVLALLGFANVYALRVNLSVALVAMVSNITVVRDGESVVESPEFTWSTSLQGVILSSFFYGYIVTQLPGGLLARKFGGKNMLGIGILCTSILTLLTPLAARSSVGFLITLRIFIGLCEGVVFPANHTLWSKWAPIMERTKLATIALSGPHIGTVIAMPLSGLLANHLGWPSIFYIFGASGMLWAVVWFLVVKESPAEDSRLSQEERDYIQSNLVHNNARGDMPIPWKSIFTSLPVWAIIVAHFSENWGFYTLLTELPSFLKHSLEFDLTRAGFVSSLPYLVMAFTIQLGGHVADYLRRKEVLTTTAVRKSMNTVGFVAQAVCLVLTGYTTHWLVAVVCLTFSVGFGGFAFSGFFVNHLDIAPPFAGILLGISNTVATIPGIVSPLLTGQIVKHQSTGEWRVVFYLGGFIYAVGAVFFLIFASGHKQHWAQDYSELVIDEDNEEQ